MATVCWSIQKSAWLGPQETGARTAERKRFICWRTERQMSDTAGDKGRTPVKGPTIQLPFAVDIRLTSSTVCDDSSSG